MYCEAWAFEEHGDPKKCIEKVGMRESDEESRRDDEERISERRSRKTGRSNRQILIDMGYLSESVDEGSEKPREESKHDAVRHRWSK